jgi:hypothetical protein
VRVAAGGVGSAGARVALELRWTPPSLVRTLVVSADGRWVYAGTDDRAVRSDSVPVRAASTPCPMASVSDRCRKSRARL